MAARYSRPALLARLLGNVTVQSVNLPLGKRREDHAHKIPPPLARAAPGLDARQDFLGRNTLRGIRQYS